MRGRGLRRDSEGIASTVATVFAIFVFLLLFQLVVFAPIPGLQYDAEWGTSRDALAALELTRSVLAGPADLGTSFSVSVPIGTAAVSPFATSSEGSLSFRPGRPGPAISFRYVPDFLRSEVKRIDQDVILAIDSSGSMNQNDPNDLRIASAKEYVDKLRCPDRIAVVDFDTDAHLTKRNLGANWPRHHLSQAYHNCEPSFAEVHSDLDTIDSDGGTNFGAALVVANDEFEAFGDHRHQWVIILLTDGLNNFPQWDDLAMQESRWAAENGTVIYTIGLGTEPDASLLGEIANNTGGRYYHAKTAEEIRWIYLEIANKYSSTFTCIPYETRNASAGSVELALAAREYPAQTLRFEGGGISLVQRGGAELREGLPFNYQPNDAASGSIGVTLMSFIGEDLVATGTGHEIMRATVVGRDLVAQQVARVNLSEEEEAIQDVEDKLEFWKEEGGATGAGVQAIVNHTGRAHTAALGAITNYTSGNVAGARDEIARAKGFLERALGEVDLQVKDFEIQKWLGELTKDDIRVTTCRLDQWVNWYDGLTFTIDSPAAAGWARWFEGELKEAGARVSVELDENRTSARLTLHTINEYVIDHRTVKLSFGQT